MSLTRRASRAWAAFIAALVLLGAGYLVADRSSGGRALAGAASPAGPRGSDGSSGDWRNWDARQWLRRAGDFINPVIDGVWGADRMRAARGWNNTMGAGVADAQGVSDPAPSPVPAQPENHPYREHAAASGKIFFDTPQGPAVCSGTVVHDPAHPGRSNLVWTAGHCVHAGRAGGWYRNVVFVPDFNDSADPGRTGTRGSLAALAPLGTWWADWAETSPEWISTGAATGGAGAPFDFAVFHVRQARGITGSLEETIGTAAPQVDFDTSPTRDTVPVGVWGYPAREPFDGFSMFRCTGPAGRLSVADDQPSLYRVGCTMNGGASGGGWLTRRGDGRLALISNTSIGPTPAVWLAGPRLGPEARKVFDTVSARFAGG
ncbi:hypothetical protein AB0G73_02475 [Streptomyces sp. NPDC020719]|uniref:trypsin-like serine peptidase n=1 Tax=Streptomyces sp. NPDC020719 TaxID=3154896 RepID=UPI00340E14CF